MQGYDRYNYAMSGHSFGCEIYLLGPQNRTFQLEIITQFDNIGQFAPCIQGIMSNIWGNFQALYPLTLGATGKFDQCLIRWVMMRRSQYQVSDNHLAFEIWISERKHQCLCSNGANGWLYVAGAHRPFKGQSPHECLEHISPGPQPTINTGISATAWSLR